MFEDGGKVHSEKLVLVSDSVFSVLWDGVQFSHGKSKEAAIHEHALIG